METSALARVIKAFMQQHGVTGQVDVKCGAEGSTVWAGEPSDDDVMITVTIEPAPPRTAPTNPVPPVSG